MIYQFNPVKVLQNYYCWPFLKNDACLTHPKLLDLFSGVNKSSEALSLKRWKVEIPFDYLRDVFCRRYFLARSFKLESRLP